MTNTLQVYNPATEKVIGEIKEFSSDDITSAAEKAKSASVSWENTSASQRAVIFITAAAKIRADADELSRLLTAEEGKPLSESRDEILGAAHVFEYYASVCGAVTGDAKHLPKYGYLNVVRKPVGICAAIIPWNMPAIIFAWKAGAAVSCGNTIIVKPSKTAPLTILKMAELINGSGLPEGVLQIATGSGETAGRELILNKDIRHISFTGSIDSGIEVSKLAAPNLKKLTLELGGNDAFIVTKSADLNKAASAAVRHRFYNCGQVCTSAKRIIVHESLVDEFVKLVSEKISKLNVGDCGLGANLGPLNNSSQRSSVSESVSKLKDAGAEIILGGEVCKGAGFFYKPTLLKNVDPKNVSEEIFGPVMSVISYSEDSEALKIANGTNYGLGASVWTADLKTARLFADELKSGVVWVNKHLILPPEMPFGGVKMSGFGRENGLDFIYEYTESKSILFG
ncbi:MAG: aldehyde dehydrogenase family protein [Methanocorpusculum sp.]|nr:aldehyde dehydrogenase family protein [Methanocorpusculum sp.]